MGCYEYSTSLRQLKERIEEHRLAAERGGYEQEHHDWCVALDLVDSELRWVSTQPGRIRPTFTLLAEEPLTEWQLATLLPSCSPAAREPNPNPFDVYSGFSYRHRHRFTQDGQCVKCGLSVQEIIELHNRLVKHGEVDRYCPGHVCDGKHPGAGLFYAGESDPLPVNRNHPYAQVIDLNALMDGDAISRQRAASETPQRQAAQ